MLMFLLIILLVVILILVVRNRRVKGDTSINAKIGTMEERINTDIRNINEEILAELAKENPDYDKMKALRAKIDELNNQKATLPAEGMTGSGWGRKSAKKGSGTNGLTVALYVGSLLILAGVGGLVLSGVKEIGLLILFLMTAVFYGGGLLIRGNETLKQASHVFVGTGMMMLPFIGLLIYDITKMDATILWMILSLVGVPMYLYAAYVMQNQVFSYFAILGFVSLSCSLASVMGLSLVWYFVFVMAVGIVFKLLIILGYGERLGVMQEAVQNTGEWLPVAAMMASFFASTSLKELDYLIVLGVLVLHLIVSYAIKPNIAYENLLRLTIPAWLILLVHVIWPNNDAVGIALGCAALAQMGLVFLNAILGLSRETHRKETEVAWMIASLVSMVAAGLTIGFGHNVEYWGWLSAALAIDTVALFVARYLFKQDVWYIGLLLTGILLPISILNASSLEWANTSTILTAVYILEMMGIEALFWKNGEASGNHLMAVSVGIFGIAALVTGASEHLQAIVFLAMAMCFFVRGMYRNETDFMELAVYCVASGIFFIIDWAGVNATWWADYRTRFAFAAHLAIFALAITQAMWGGKIPPYTRILIGSVVLLFVMACIATSGTEWAMYLFLVETVIIMLFGLTMKDQKIRNTGVIGAFLAVLWFTRNLSFVWPILLGFGIIGVVVFMLMRNGQKTPPLPPQV